MDIRFDKIINFDWFWGTHKKITKAALEFFPRLEKYEALFKEFVVRPDFTEKGFLRNWHFYLPEKGKSYLDFSGKGNAYARYKLHVKKMLFAIAKGHTYQAIKCAGKALHYLQDMTQPHHTQGGFIATKFLNLFTHRGFESFVKKHEDRFLEGLAPDPFMPKDFDELFQLNVEFSTNITTPVKKNKDSEWERIAHAGLQQAARSTHAFLEMFDKLLPAC